MLSVVYVFLVMTYMILFVDQVRLAQLHKAEELMPTTNDPEHFSFWVCVRDIQFKS